MVLERLFKSHAGIILISIIWGLGLSTLFHSASRSRDCYIIRGPDLKLMEKQVFNYDTGQCYKYVPVAVKCQIEN